MSKANIYNEDYFENGTVCGISGYFNYHWMPEMTLRMVHHMIQTLAILESDIVLDFGCAKGYMLYDLAQQLPNITVKGIDVSNWAIENSHPSVSSFLEVRDAKDLGIFKDKEFDLVVSINTVHNLPLEECKQSLRELERVGKACFVTVDSWNTPEEEQKMRDWNLTAQTMMSVGDWKSLFKEVGYSGDFYWFIP